MKEKLLALDPSSTRTGYAIMESPDTVVEAGYLRGRTSDQALDRILRIERELTALFFVNSLRWCVIEIPSGKVGARHGGGGAGLAVYGMAVGILLGFVNSSLCGGKADTVTETVWTRGVPKAKRRQLIAAQFPMYRRIMSRDSGGDVSDAIGLGQWWFHDRKLRAAERRMSKT